MKRLNLILSAVLLVLLANLWVGDANLFDLYNLHNELEQTRVDNEKLATRNQILAAEVMDLKTGTDAIEENARQELGMIREGETFYQVVQSD